MPNLSGRGSGALGRERDGVAVTIYFCSSNNLFIYQYHEDHCRDYGRGGYVKGLQSKHFITLFLDVA